MEDQQGGVNPGSFPPPQGPSQPPGPGGFPPPAGPGGFPPPQGPPIGYPPSGGMNPAYGQPRPKTAGLAIASLVTAFFCWLVSIPLGFVALSKIKKSNGQLKGRGLAIAGIVLSFLGLAAVGGIFALGAAFDDKYQTVNELAVGDCINLPEPDDDGSISFFALDAADCAGTHDGRVIETFTEDLNDENQDQSPDAIALGAFERCSDAFEGDTGEELLTNEDLDVQVLWGDSLGERDLVCLLVRVDGDPLEVAGQ